MKRTLLGALVALMAPFAFQPALAQSAGYRIQPGDELAITVLEDDTLNRTALVLPDGQISVPLAGTIRASGQRFAPRLRPAPGPRTGPLPTLSRPASGAADPGRSAGPRPPRLRPGRPGQPLSHRRASGACPRRLPGWPSHCDSFRGGSGGRPAACPLRGLSGFFLTSPDPVRGERAETGGR